MIDTKMESFKTKISIYGYTDLDLYFFSTVGEFDEEDYQELVSAYKVMLQEKYYSQMLEESKENE